MADDIQGEQPPVELAGAQGEGARVVHPQAAPRLAGGGGLELRAGGEGVLRVWEGCSSRSCARVCVCNTDMQGGRRRVCRQPGRQAG